MSCFLKTLKETLKKVELGSLFIKIKFLGWWFVFLHGALVLLLLLLNLNLWSAALVVVLVRYMYFINSHWFSQMTPTFLWEKH